MITVLKIENHHLYRKSHPIPSYSKHSIMTKDHYSRLYRIMHWAIAITFLLLLLTVFLRLTWMNKENVADIIKPFMVEKGIELSDGDAIILAKKIRKPMWEWHIYFGYALTGLFAIRFLLPLAGQMKFQNPRENGLTNLQRFQRYTYWVFYLCVIVSLVTGLIIELGPKEYKKNMEAIHELSLYYLIPYIILHIGGVLRTEFVEKRKIISEIIGGSNRTP